MCDEWLCVQESEKYAKDFNKLSVRMQHVDFHWSLQIFLPNLLCFFGTTLWNIQIHIELEMWTYVSLLDHLTP